MRSRVVGAAPQAAPARQWGGRGCGMALIVKCDPSAVSFTLSFDVAVRPFGDVSPAKGDEVFGWTSESARGQGLAMHGTIETAVSSRSTARRRCASG